MSALPISSTSDGGGRRHRHFGLDLGDAAERRMRDWIDANPQHKHGRHEYSAAQFGLSEQAIHERFADYMTRHDLFER
ncbi:MAG: hypothetical protein IPJ52_05765 [Rhodocyclaceae bacterium]|nr:hypothetical protein [Rhodocyclaceae bacterium]